MARPVQFPEADRVEDYQDPAHSSSLPVKAFSTSSVSCWQLDAAEKAEVAVTGELWLTTQTYQHLDARSDGERYQPAVSITTRRDQALAGWSDFPSDTAPAADRIVRYSDNQAGFEAARDALAQVAKQLTEGNDHGGLDQDEVEDARRQIMIIQHAFACEAIHIGWIVPPALKSLRWIADKALGALIGHLAVTAIEIIVTNFGN
ncbi:hypothetical protein EJC47_13860 [Sphingomonas sp. TF3]|uniref:hypothetical protein n=1 Tax=Sphingomonas sp. TF3 TaxID=2495580 RepID=UPI000F895EB9|nr:hypothetical protein [Sphingomonas sp. TF3]RUN75996.1 hypothetical protein EJC47_13860 [Sphingomonas sp. TF3]